MFCFDMLNNNLYVIFYCEKFGEKEFIYYLCKRKQETNKILYDYENNVSYRTLRHQPQGRSMALIGFSRVDYRVKNLVMKSVRKQGYRYDRSEKAYILETDPIDFCADKAVTVKSYAI